MEEILTIKKEIEEIEDRADSIGDRVLEVLDKMPSYKRSNLSDEQRATLSSLSPDIVMELRGHLYNSVREQSEREKNGDSNSMDKYRERPKVFMKGVLKGEVFERLVVLDPVIKKERFDKEDMENESKIKHMEELSNEILSVMQNPARYGLEEKIQVHRLPDATYINITDKGYVEILGVGEAKSGSIHDRFYQQADNYRRSVNTVAGELSKLRHVKRLRNLGLVHLADRMEKSGMEGVSNFVRVSPNFKKTLIVPQNKKIEDDLIKESVDNIIHSSFTNYEIAAITDFFYDEIKKIDEDL